MCIDRFKSIACTRLFPVFKYVKNASAPPADNSKLKAYMDSHNSVEKIISKNIEKTIKNVPVFSNYRDLLKAMENIDDTNKKSGMLLKNIRMLSAKEIRNACVTIFEIDRDVAKKSTNFNRCVMYLDFIENFITEKSQ